MAKRIAERTPRDLVIEQIEKAGIDGILFTTIERETKLTFATVERTITELEAEKIIEGTRLDGYRLSISEFARRIDMLRRCASATGGLRKNRANVERVLAGTWTGAKL